MKGTKVVTPDFSPVTMITKPGRPLRRIAWLLLVLAIMTLILLDLSNQHDWIRLVLPGDESAAKITLHIGLNDRNTYQQELSAEQAQQIIADACLNHVQGFTLYPSFGQYLDSTGKRTQENGFIVEFYGADQAAVARIMDELLVKLNQESILYENTAVRFSFYSRQVAVP